MRHVYDWQFAHKATPSGSFQGFNLLRKVPAPAIKVHRRQQRPVLLAATVLPLTRKASVAGLNLHWTNRDGTTDISAVAQQLQQTFLEIVGDNQSIGLPALVNDMEEEETHMS